MQEDKDNPIERDRTEESIHAKNRELKKIFTEIIRGYSVINLSNFGVIFLKHLGEIDSAEVEIQYDVFYNFALSKGILKQSEKEKSLISSGEWSKENDVKIRDLKFFINRMIESKNKLFRSSDIEKIENEIKNSRNEINLLISKKFSLLGQTAESYASNKINEFYLFNSSYEDASLTKKKFSKDQFEELEAVELYEIINCCNSKIASFSSKRIQTLSLSSLFMNLFNLCDGDAYKFYGKPIHQLTFYQCDLFSNGIYFKKAIENSRVKPPIEMYEDPEEMLKFLTVGANLHEIAEKSGSKTKNKNGRTSGMVATSIVGASKEDLSKAGIANDNNSVNFRDVIKKHGGKMTMQQAMDAGIL